MTRYCSNYLTRPPVAATAKKQQQRCVPWLPTAVAHALLAPSTKRREVFGESPMKGETAMGVFEETKSEGGKKKKRKTKAKNYNCRLPKRRGKSYILPGTIHTII